MAKTPSQSKKQELSSIAGNVITCNQNIALIEEHQKKLDNKIVANDIISSVVSSLDSSQLFMKSAANMLMAIAGYLFGEKNINLNTDATTLFNKIKNTAPILGEGISTDPDDIINAAPSSGYIELVVSGLDKDGLNGLVAVMDQMYQGFGNENAKAIEVFAIALDTLEQVSAKILSMNLDNFDKKFINHTISFKEVLNILGKEIDSQNSIGKIKGLDITISNLSQLATKLKESDIKAFNKKYIDNILTFHTAIEKINGILETINSSSQDVNLVGIQNFVAISQALQLKLSDLDPTMLESYDMALDSFMSIIDKLSIIDFSVFDTSYIENLSMLSAVTDILNAINFTSEVSVADMETYSQFSDMVYYIIDNFSKLNLKAFDDSYMQSASDFSVVLDIVSDITKTITKQIPLLFIIDLFKQQLLDYPTLLSKFISGEKGNGGLLGVMNRINKAEAKGLSIVVMTEFFKDFEGLITTLNTIGKASITASITSNFIDKAIDTVILIIDKIVTLDIKEIIANIENIKKAAEFMDSMKTVFIAATICALTAIPATVGLLVIWAASKLVFKVLDTVITGFNNLPDIKDFKNSIKSLGLSLILLGSIMIIAAFAGELALRNMASILGFGLVLGLFILSVVGPLLLITKFGGNEKIISSLGQITNLIIACSIIMIFGAVFYKSKMWKDSLLFGAVLGGFILTVLLPFAIVSLFAKEAINVAKDITSLVIGCALILMIGALFMQTGLWKEALQFGLMVIGFVTLIMLPFAIISIFGKTAISGVKQIAGLVITLSLILVFGALFMLTGLWKESLEFAGMVTLFTWAVVLPFLIAGKNIENAYKPLLGLSILVAVSAGILILAGLTMEDVSFSTLLGFTVCVGLLVGEMAYIAYLVSKEQENIMKGIPALLLLAVVATLSAIPIKIFGDTIATIGSEDAGAKMLAMVICASALLLAIGALSYAAGALVMGPQALLFMAGIGALSLITTVAILAGKALQNIGVALLIMQKVEQGGGIDTSNITNLIGTFIDISKALSEVESEIDTGALIRVSFSMMAVARMTSKLGIAVQDVANLKAATAWDRDGNPTAYRQLNDKDFSNAATNTKTIVSTLGRAIIELYNGVGLPDGISKSDVQEMFAQPSAGGLAGLFGKKGDSKFDLVVRSCTGLGRMISMIGIGVQDVANLKVATAWDGEGNATAFRQLNNQDFTNAAINIKNIISTLGGAILETFAEHKDMFEVPPIEVGGLFFKVKIPGKGKTPFEKVVQACTAMGGMISSIAKGVGDMANLKVAETWDKDGNPTSYRYLNNEDFTKAAVNTSQIITTLGSALANLYYGKFPAGFKSELSSEDVQKMFNTDYVWVDGHLQSSEDTPMIRVLTAASLMGGAISSIAAGVQDMADLRVENYDADGKPLGTYRTLKEDDFKDAGEKTAIVVTCLANALDTVYKRNQKLFDPVYTMVCTHDGLFSDDYEQRVEDAPIIRVLKAAGNIGTFVSDCAAAVKAVADLSFVDSEGNRVAIDINQLKPGRSLEQKISTLVTCIGRSLDNIYSSGKSTYFNADWEPYKLIPKTLDVCKGVVNQSVDTVNALYELFDTVNVGEINKDWNSAIIGLFKPFESGKVTDEGLSLFDRTTRLNTGNIESLVREVNSLQISKVDKFIELSQELRGLSVSFDDLGGLVEALNGKINDTLSTLAEKLEYAATTIELSDKAQERRQKYIEKNTKAISDVMKRPMTIKVERDVTMKSGTTAASYGSTDSNTATSVSSSGSGNAMSSAVASQIASNTLAIKNLLNKLINK